MLENQTQLNLSLSHYSQSKHNNLILLLWWIFLYNSNDIHLTSYIMTNKNSKTLDFYHHFDDWRDVCYFLFIKNNHQNSNTTHTAGLANIESTVIAGGQVYAEKLIDVGAQATGRVDRLHVKLGQRVKRRTHRRYRCHSAKNALKMMRQATNPCLLSTTSKSSLLKSSMNLTNKSLAIKQAWWRK